MDKKVIAESNALNEDSLVKDVFIKSQQITSENYVENVLKTDCKYTPDLLKRLTDSVRLLHASIGLVTEAGEFLDMLKKHIYQNKPLDVVNAKEECGDAMFYIGLAMDDLSVTMNAVLTQNINKLKLRYPQGFSNEKALNRDVDAERVLLEKDFNKKEIARAIDCGNKHKEFTVGEYPDYILPVPPPKPLPLSLYTQWDNELKREFIVVDGVRFIKEKENWGPTINFPVSKEPFEQIKVTELDSSQKEYKSNSHKSFESHSKRGQDWLNFSAKVLTHIEEYCTEQYGDKGNDIATDYTPEYSLSQVDKYIKRYGKVTNERQLRDFLKIAHYCQLAATKYQEELTK